MNLLQFSFLSYSQRNVNMTPENSATYLPLILLHTFPFNYSLLGDTSSTLVSELSWVCDIQAWKLWCHGGFDKYFCHWLDYLPYMFCLCFCGVARVIQSLDSILMCVTFVSSSPICFPHPSGPKSSVILDSCQQRIMCEEIICLNGTKICCSCTSVFLI